MLRADRGRRRKGAKGSSVRRLDYRSKRLRRYREAFARVGREICVRLGSMQRCGRKRSYYEMAAIQIVKGVVERFHFVSASLPVALALGQDLFGRLGGRD